MDYLNSIRAARLKRIAERLKNARADIRALTPPQDEETTQEQIDA